MVIFRAIFGDMDFSGDKYSIGGLPVADLINRFGSPLYVYNADKILQQIGRLKNAFSVPLQIKYAMKALSNLSLLKWMGEQGIGVDAVSIQEVHLALHAGLAPADIVFSPNCASFDEITEAVKLGVCVNLDNLPYLEKFGQLYGSGYPCIIRLNPDIMAGGNEKISTGHSDSKFGISLQQMHLVRQIVDRYNVKVTGLHIHTGSDIDDVAVYEKMADIFLSCLSDFPHVRILDFGSGFKVPYYPDDNRLDIERLGKLLSEKVRAFSSAQHRPLELWVEPGKFLVSEAGYLLASCTVVKETPSRTFVGLNTGLNHLLRPMMYGAYHHIINVSNPFGEEKKYTVVGYICETDTFGMDRMIPEVRENDILAICNAGAYGYAMASQYNSRPRPAEVIVLQGTAHLVRRAEQLEDLLHGQAIVDLAVGKK